MTTFVSESMFHVLAAPSSGGYVGLPVIVLLALLVLIFEKQVTASRGREGERRLSACLDVGVAPLSIAGAAISVHQLARVMGWVSA